MNEDVKFTYLSRSELHFKLLDRGIEASPYHIVKLLDRLGLSQKKMAKTGTHKQVEGRNEQFEYISVLVRKYMDGGQIVVSMDAKKKELLGQLYRKGKVYCNKPQIVNDHDFPSFSTGRVSPFGVYDKKLNEGYVFLGQSSDTPDFAVDCLYDYLKFYGLKRYPAAKELLVL